MTDPITRICYPYCELFGAALLLIMIVLFLCVLGYIYSERSRAMRRERDLDLERERQLDAYRRSKDSTTSELSNEKRTSS